MCIDYPSYDLLFVKMAFQTCDVFIFQMLSIVFIVNEKLSKSIKSVSTQSKVLYIYLYITVHLSRKHEVK